MRMENKLIVVSNSSPLMNLAIIGQLELLHKLFKNIIIPEEVWIELTVDGKGKPGADAIINSDWIKVVSIHDINLFKLLKQNLDIGEAAAITLALEINAGLILLDEINARYVADIYNLSKAGVIGVLMRAKRSLIINELKPFLDELRNKAGFWIKQNFYEKILIEMGEKI